jgi:hypothetical protein
MTPDDLEPLSPAAQELLALERQRQDPDGLAKDRVLQRLSATLGFAAVAAGALVSTGAVVAGGAVYAGMSTKVRALEAQMRDAKASRAAPGAPTVIPAAQTSLPIAAAAAAPEQQVHPGAAPPRASAEPKPAKLETARPAPAPAPIPSEPDALADENALLEQARTALVRGQGEAALRALDEHQRAYSNGLLQEERDALRVQVLVKLGRREEAQRAATTFRERHAGSLLQPSVDAALDNAR